MKKIFKLFLIFSLAAAALPVFAGTAEVTFVRGKVEVNKNGAWVALKPGDKIQEAEVVSTGFQSEAKVKYESTLLYLAPLTRVTLKDLASTSTGDKVNVTLSTGSVRAKVTHPDDRSVNCSIRTPVSVASVRGTDIAIFDDGSIWCNEGVVSVFDIKMLEREAGDNLEEVIEQIQNDESLPSAAGSVFISQNQSASVGKGQVSIQNETEKSVAEVVSVVMTAAAQAAVETGMADSTEVIEISSDDGIKMAPLTVVVGAVHE